MACDLQHIVLCARLFSLTIQECTQILWLLPALPAVRASSSISVIRGQRIKECLSDSPVCHIPCELICTCISNNLWQMEVRMWEWEVSKIVLTNCQWRCEHPTIEASCCRKVRPITSVGIQIVKHIVHATPFTKKHPLPEFFPSRCYG